MKTDKSISIFVRGMFSQNPAFTMGLGLCAGIASGPDVRKALLTGVFTFLTLVISSPILSAMKKVLPRQVRIPCLVLLTSGSITLIRFMLKAYFPVFESGITGYYLPLVCSCLVLGHTESYVFSHSIRSSAIHAAGSGLGYTLALTVMAAIREILGCGTFLGKTVLPSSMHPMYFFAMAPGALFTAGCVCAFVKWALGRKGARK